MFPGMNSSQMAGMMKKMGISQAELPVKKVIFELEDSKLVIEDPSVIRIKMQGQESYQVTGEATEETLEEEIGFSEEDIQMVMAQSGCDEEKAKEILEECEGDLAEAIIRLKE